MKAPLRCSAWSRALVYWLVLTINLPTLTPLWAQQAPGPASPAAAGSTPAGMPKCGPNATPTNCIDLKVTARNYYSAKLTWSVTKADRDKNFTLEIRNAEGEVEQRLKIPPREDEVDDLMVYSFTVPDLTPHEKYTAALYAGNDRYSSNAEILRHGRKNKSESGRATPGVGETEEAPPSAPCPNLANDTEDLQSGAARDTQNTSQDRRGEITVNAPKVWDFEKVHPLLDGVLRDVESVSIKAPTDLDPSETNSTALRFIESVFAASASYDQKAAFDNRVARENLDLTREQQIQTMRINQDRIAVLIQRRNLLDENLNQALQERTEAQQAVNNARASGDDTKLQQAQNDLTAVQAKIDGINKDLTDNQSQIAAAGTPPTLTGGTAVNNTSAADITADLIKSSGFSGLFANLGDDAKKQISQKFGMPSYPATQRMDLFLSTVYERMTRQLNAVQDDLIRDPGRQAYLLAFDVGLYPSHRSANHVARVAFELECEECRVYALYPEQSSYNLAEFYGSTDKKSIYGTLSTLFGLGAKAQYQRQREDLHNGMVQSVYVSGFERGNRFGWYYGGPPFEKTPTPGIHSTFAIVTVPSGTPELVLNRWVDWVRRDNPEVTANQGFAIPILNHKVLAAPFVGRKLLDDPLGDCGLDGGRKLAVKLPPPARVVDKHKHQLHLVKLEYETTYFKADDETKDTDKRATHLLIELNKPVDPNLLLLVNGTQIPRVRDWRGRANSTIAAGQTPGAAGVASQYKTRSIFEVDAPAADTWVQASSHTILLSVSQQVAGAEDFPLIQLIDPTEAVVIPHDVRSDETTIIANGFKLSQSLLDEDGNVPGATYLPLFAPEPRRVNIVPSFDGREWLEIRMQPDKDGPATAAPSKFEWLPSRAQVIVEQDSTGYAWSLQCFPRGAVLRCRFPGDEIRKAVSPNDSAKKYVTDLQVWVEQTDPDRIRGARVASSAPQRIGLLPVDPEQAAIFRPWRFDHAESDSVYVTGCGYFSTKAQKDIDPCSLAFVDQLYRSAHRAVQITKKLGDPNPCLTPLRVSEDGCACIPFPTRDLDRDELDVPVLRKDQCSLIGAIAVAANSDYSSSKIPTASLKGALGTPKVVSTWSKSDKNYVVESWQLDFPVKQLIQGDGFFELEQQGAPAAADCVKAEEDKNAYKGIRAQFVCRPSGPPEVLRITVPKDQLGALPSELHVTRGPEHTIVGLIPGLRNYILPATVSLTKKNNTTFQLQGPHAAAIQEVALQKGGDSLVGVVTTIADDIVEVVVKAPAAARKATAPAKESEAASSPKPEVKAQAAATSAPAAAASSTTANATTQGTDPNAKKQAPAAASSTTSNGAAPSAAGPKKKTPATPAPPSIPPGDYAVIAIAGGVPVRIKDDKGAPIVWTVSDTKTDAQSPKPPAPSKVLKVAMSKAEVVAAFGPPDIEAVSGTTTTLKYKDMTIELENDKVKSWKITSTS